MISQESIDLHASEVGRLASSFRSQLSRELDPVVGGISTFAVRYLQTSHGKVVRSPKNSRAILSIGDEFERLMAASNYHAAILAFVGEFFGQLRAFEKLYAAMGTEFKLPMVKLSEEGRDALSNQGAAAVAVLEGNYLRASISMREFLSRSLGDVKRSELVNGAIDVVRKVSEVESIAKDQVMLWFRVLCSIVYSSVEESVGPLAYSYVGKVGEFSRDFCKGLQGKSFSRKEIDSISNGQTLGAFTSGGGYGCLHWWAIARGGIGNAQ